MPVKEMAGAPPITARKRILPDVSPESFEPLPPMLDPGPAADAPAMETSKRRMPENLRKFLLRVQGGKFYLPAAYRIAWFRDECPDWGVSTVIVEGGEEAGFATVKATIYNAEGRVIATGHKTESRKDFPAGHVEKAETGAVARALAVAGFGTQFSPELDEEVFADSPQPMSGGYAGRRDAVRSNGGNGNGVNHVREAVTAKPAGEVWEGPGQCPNCHAPEGKRHGKPCVSV